MPAFYIIPFVLILAADQITKLLVAARLEVGQSVPAINGLFDITYVQNQGAAFGILQGRKLTLILVTVVIFVFLIIYALRRNTSSWWLMWSLTLITSGGIGNLIDRIFNNGLVVDFIDVRIINFPIFNFADICAVCGAGLLLLTVIIDEIRELKRKKSSPEDDETAEEIADDE